MIKIAPFIAICFLVSGCSGHSQPQQGALPNSGQTEVVAEPSRLKPLDTKAVPHQPKQPEQELPGASLIPSDVSYSVIKTDIVPNVKRGLDVRIDRRVSQDVLRAVALKLKAQDARTYERTFIAYYLPGMEPGSGAWATTHFNPDLEVRILGVSVEEESALKSQPEEQTHEVIGSWLDETIGLSCRITIYRRNNKIYGEEKYKDGSSRTDELIESGASGARRLVKKNPVNPQAALESGDHWLIDGSGDLQIRDNEGLIRTAKKFP